MTKRLSKREKIDMFIEDAINKMFEIAGHDVTFDDIKDRKDEWYNEWTMTISQSDEWHEWGVNEIRKRFRYTKKWAQKEMNMVGLMWNLSIRDL